MDDVDLKIAAMEKELTELRALIEALGERLGRGDNAVRADLNAAIRRQNDLSSELRDVKTSSGRLTTDDLMRVQVMYGPPWRFSTRSERQPAPMYGPPPIGGAGKLPRLWRRLFRRK